MKTTALILAAGHGVRMNSVTPKVLHPLARRPLIHYALSAVSGLSDEKPVVVVGHGAEDVSRVIGEEGARFVVQEQQLGTAHAVSMAEDMLKGQTDLVLVTFGDMPLFRPETLRRLVDVQKENSGPLTLTTVVQEDSHGFGRIVRDAQGRVREIVEEAQAGPEILAIKEVNVSAYCFRADWLWDALRRVKVSPKGEYYLTDLVGLAVADGLEVRDVRLEDREEAMGINNRVHLAEAEAILRRRINQGWMMAGVTMIDPAATYIEPGVTIGRDTILWPNTHLQGSTVIGENCQIGPNSVLMDTRVGSGCTIIASFLEGALLENGVSMGPYVHLRKGAHLADGVHMGNFGEVKNSYLGAGTRMGHFSYIGDATIGKDVNIGAGTITCNYDGEHKHHTEIGDNVFIGSDTMLVAPVEIGEGAHTGAGAVVTKDVAPNTLVVGVPARLLRTIEKRD